MLMDELEKLKGRQVEIVYNGILYRGTLVGADEDEVNLKTTTSWLALPMVGISTVRAATRSPFDGIQSEDKP
jgi:hypothetical protein